MKPEEARAPWERFCYIWRSLGYAFQTILIYLSLIGFGAGIATMVITKYVLETKPKIEDYQEGK